MSSELNLEKRNIKLLLMYDGLDFCGWQRLNNTKKQKESIQGLLENRLSLVLEEDIKIIGSGRTDAGVHALAQVCNFITTSLLKTEVIISKLRKLLPESIQIVNWELTDLNFHSRYNALRKVYEYRIDTKERECVFTRRYTYPSNQTLDVTAMKKAANYLVGEHDFKAFSTDRKDGKSTVRHIYRLEVNEYRGKNGSQEVRIECEGNGFLQHMVRIIAGTLLEVGQNKRSIDSVKDALISKERKNAGVLLYPQGLFLKQVIY